MILFGDRKKIEEAYKEWLKENPQVADCPFNVISFMVGEGLVKDKIKTDFYERSSMSKINSNIAERFDYLKKNPSAFMEEICGVKLSAWQRYILDNMSKYDSTPRKPMKRWNFYLELCWKYSRMNDNEYVVIASPKKWEKLSKAELLEYIENYWK